MNPTPTPDTDPDLQGEGNYEAARRHRKAEEDFVQSGQVQPAAEAAKPQSPEEAKELADAEAEARARARG